MELSTFITWYEDSVQATDEARRLAERDRDYYDNKQLTSEEESELTKRGQPAIVINRIKSKIDFLLGTERQQRTDPRAAPRNPMDEEASHAATDAIRFVCDANEFSSIRSDVFENLIIEGSGGAIVEVKKKADKFEIVVRKIPWDRHFYDAHARSRDYTDAKYKGIVAWMDVDDAVAIYGDEYRDMLESAMGPYADNQTYEDKPTLWVDGKRKRIKVCEVYYRQGLRWMYCVYTKGGFLIDPKDSPYLNEDGEPCCPIEYQACHVDRENRRYGVVRQLIGPQDEINKRRSKALHLITMRQVRIERGATDDLRQVRKELAKPDGVIETNPGHVFEVLDTNDMAQGNLGLLQEAKAEIDAIGANAALTGKDEQSQSGRALQARQQGGLIELGPVFDALRQWQRRIYKQIWARVKQYWTEEMWVRVTDDENNIRFAGLNRQMTYAEQQIEHAKEKKLPKDQMQALVEQLAQDPKRDMPVIENSVSEMDMDIIMEDVPDTVNIQAEQFEQLVAMYQAAPDQIPFHVVIEASSIRNKKQILEGIKPDEQAAEKAAQEKQIADQMTMEAAQGKLDEQSLKNEKLAADLEEMRAKLPGEVEKLQVETAKIFADMIAQLQSATQQLVGTAQQSRPMVQ